MSSRVGWGMVRRELRKLGSDLLECQPDAFGEDDEGDAAEGRRADSPVTRAGSLRGDQATLLVEMEGGGGDAASAGDLTDRQQFGHGQTHSLSDLTSSSL